MNIYIDKSITGAKNLEALIQDSIYSTQPMAVEYGPASLRKVAEDADGRNTAVDVTLKEGNVVIEATAFYKRPDISIVPDGRKNPEDDLPVFLYDGNITLLYDQSTLDNVVRPLVSERLNIPQDSFRIESVDLSNTKKGLIKFEIVAKQSSEVIIGRTHGYLTASPKKHYIHDIKHEYGLGLPADFTDGKVKGWRPNNTTNRAFFEQQPIATYDDIARWSRTDAEIHSSMIKSYLQGSYTSTPVDEFEISQFSQNTDGTSSVLVRIKNSTDYEKFGEYITTQFDPQKDFVHTKVKVWDKTLQRRLVHNTEDGKNYFHVPEGFVSSIVTKTEAELIQTYIMQELLGSYGLPKDTITMHPDFLANWPAQGKEVPVYNFRFTNSAVVKNGPYEIHLLYEKINRCANKQLSELIDGFNSIGAIEGIKDGWSTTNIEWWEIDAGAIRRENGTVITRPEGFKESSSWEYHFIPIYPGVRSTYSWHGGFSNGVQFKDDSNYNPGKVTDTGTEVFEKEKTNAHYKYTNLDGFGNPYLTGFKL